MVIRVEAEEPVRIFSKVHETLRVHYAGEKYDYRRWFAKGIGLVQEELIVPGRSTITKKAPGLSTLGDRGL